MTFVGRLFEAEATTLSTMVMAHLCLEHPQEALEDPNGQRGFEKAMLAGWFSRIQKMNKNFGVILCPLDLGEPNMMSSCPIWYQILGTDFLFVLLFGGGTLTFAN